MRSLGQLLPAEQRPLRPPGYNQNELERVEEQFYARLRALRRERYELSFRRHSSALGSPEHAHQHRHDLTDTRDWPGWTVHTLQYLYNLFVLYFNRDRGRMEESRASALCEDLGDRSARHERRARFANSDVDNDGWLSFEELLPLIYYSDGPVDNTWAQRMWRKTERGEKLPEQPDEPEDEQLLEKLRQLLKAPDAAMEEAEEGAAKAAAEVEEARNSLRPLARSVYEMSRRAEHLVGMSPQAQIQYGFL
ncbi:hypothetical protein R5R35_008576 [Gryllus longicercus]|uniref:EF-hand domain-containing protein n=1 Tax=Gryllus longicercus TaxID=2509291 RepID=A0AAN9V9U0_9ORTH